MIERPDNEITMPPLEACPHCGSTELVGLAYDDEGNAIDEDYVQDYHVYCSEIPTDLDGFMDWAEDALDLNVFIMCGCGAFVCASSRFEAAEIWNRRYSVHRGYCTRCGGEVA